MSAISTKRLGLLTRQYWVYNKKLILLSLGGFTTGLFVFLYGVHTITNFTPWRWNEGFALFAFLFTILSVAYAGFAFPGLRTKEKAHSYLMVPATISEKYLFEFLNRIILFLIVMPLLYWLVYNLEGYWARMLHPEFGFAGFSYFQKEALGNPWLKVMSMFQGLLLLTAPFLGAVVYRRYPIVKTFLWAILISVVHMILAYIWQRNFHGGFESLNNSMILPALYMVLINIGVLTLSYFKLKAKQV